MDKAQTGVAGPVVAELAYRNEAIAIEGQRIFAEEAWRKNRCHELKPEVKELQPPVVAPAPGGPRRADFEVRQRRSLDTILLLRLPDGQITQDVGPSLRVKINRWQYRKIRNKTPAILFRQRGVGHCRKRGTGSGWMRGRD